MSKRQLRRIKRVETTKKLITILIFITIYVSIFSLSKYQSTITGGHGTRIAKWDVQLNTEGSDNVINLAPGDSTGQSYDLTVTSISEVSVKYSIVISNLPNNVQVALDSGTPQTPNNNVVTFEDCGSFSVGSINTTNHHTLNFSALSQATNVIGSQVNIDVIFTQID